MNDIDTLALWSALLAVICICCTVCVVILEITK
jgi:hypothetical protein